MIPLFIGGPKFGGADFDGSNDYMSRAGLTGISDGKQGTLSAWIRLDGGDGNSLRILGITPTAGVLRLSASRIAGGTNKLTVQARNAAGTIILNLITNNSYTAGSNWYHFLASWDLATAGAHHLYINNSSDLSVNTFTNDTIDYAPTDPITTIGAADDGTTKFDGCMAEVFFHTSYIDLSVESNRAKFINGGHPVYLGADGSLPLSVQPLVYQTIVIGETVSNFGTNKGSGGDFTITGTLTAADTAP